MIGEHGVAWFGMGLIAVGLLVLAIEYSRAMRDAYPADWTEDTEGGANTPPRSSSAWLVTSVLLIVIGLAVALFAS